MAAGAMKGLALLVGTSLSLALPTPATAEAGPTELWPMAIDAAGTEGFSPSPDTAADSRLMLHLGMLFALLYVAFLCAWLSTTRRRRALGQTRRRVRDSCAALANSAVALARSVTGRPAATPAATDTPWPCEIAWKPGPVWSRFQPVIVTSDDRKRRVVAESTGLRWPPRDVRNPPTREPDAALGALVASSLATGWEPVQSSGSWSERRFVWRRPSEPPTKLRPTRRRPSTSPAGVRRSRETVGSHSVQPARGWASPGTDTGARVAPPH